jgi:hypothetical protein
MSTNTNKDQLMRKLAKLETMNDQLITELAYVDHLMRSVGFANGLETVKATALELIEREQDDYDDEELDDEEAV